MSYKPHLDFDKALLRGSNASRHRRHLLLAAAVLISLYLLFIASGTHVSRHQLSSAIASYSPWTESDILPSAAELAAAEEAELGSAAPFPASLVKIPETKPGPSGDEIVLLMASDDKGNQGNPIPHLHERAYENRKEYADWHGYTLVDYNFDDFPLPSNIHPIWKKIPAIRRAFASNPSATWVLWLDLDVILMTASLPLSTHLLAPSILATKLLRSFPLPGHTTRITSAAPNATAVDLISACHWAGVNAGVMLLRRSAWTDMLLDLWMDPLLIEKDWPAREQDALVWLLEMHDSIWEHVGVVSQRDLNANAFEDEKAGWQEGDLLVHLAGCWVNGECEEHWEDFWRRRSPVPIRYLQEARQWA